MEPRKETHRRETRRVRTCSFDVTERAAESDYTNEQAKFNFKTVNERSGSQNPGKDSAKHQGAENNLMKYLFLRNSFGILETDASMYVPAVIAEATARGKRSTRCSCLLYIFFCVYASSS